MKNELIRTTLNLFREYIMYKYDSKNTSDAYVSAVGVFLNHFKEKSEPKEINADEVIKYLMDIPNLHTRRNSHSAIKLFYKHKSKNGFSNKFRYIPYPEKPDTLPNPISKEEFILIINACDNIKHKCILMLGFDAGLRVSEVINLRLEDIDTFKMQIRINGSKGKKDRIVKLSSVLSNYIQEYLQIYKPQTYLFNGQFELIYSVRSCQQILKNCAKKAGLKRNVKFHDNRHGFAQTLLDNGTGLERIQDLLGHASAKTTRIYARMNNKILQSVESPLEQIVNNSITKDKLLPNQNTQIR